MAIWHRQSSATSARMLRTERRKARKQAQMRQNARRSTFEQCEPRYMFAVPPQLVSIIPSAGDLLDLTGANQRSEEFRELTFRFDEGQRIDQTSAQNGGIQVFRAGGDGVFGNGNDINITPNLVAKNGFIGIGDRPNEVVVRFSDHLPDDLYQIRIIGAGTVPLRNVEQQAFNNGVNRSVNFDLDLGPQIIAVVPQPIRRVGGQLQQARNEIEVYFNNDDLSQTAATNPAFYQLIRSRRTANNLDDGAPILPTSVVYDPIADKVRLVFATDIAGLDTSESVYRLRVGNRYTSPLAPIVRTVQQIGEAGDTFATAVNVNQQIASAALGSQSAILQGEIRQVTPYAMELPGGNDEPGDRDIPARDFPLTEVRRGVDSPHVEEMDGHQTYTTGTVQVVNGVVTLTGGTWPEWAADAYLTVNGTRYSVATRDNFARLTLDDITVNAAAGTNYVLTRDGVETFYYSFKTIYGADRNNNPLTNLMSPTQKQRAREAFEYYAKYLGVQFIEVNEAFNIAPPGHELFVVALGDLRAVDPITNTGPGNALVLASRERNLAVVDNAEDWGASEPGGAYFRAVMQGIGELLGMGHAFDLPATTIMGDTRLTTPDAAFPGDQDIVHGRHTHRPESTDIDVYKFTLNQAGVFSGEVAAERLAYSSLLDSAIWVYNSNKELIAHNDDYYSEDSFTELELQPGDYYIAVTSTGSAQIDPAIPNSGFGGTTEGNYELRLNFKPSPERNPTAASGLVDIDGTPTLLDGDNDGKPGGEYNFWFTVASSANTFIVDKSAPDGGTGSLASPFNNIPTAFAAATARNNDGNSTNDVRVVRIVGNGGADGNLATLADNLAYEVGFNSLGQPLADGPEMQVPKGVTVMVDAGAIFKLRRANIDVGSKSQGVDRSEGHLQVLGTPTQSVYFTSYHNEVVGRDTFALPTTPTAGDWGGIVYRNELDYDAERSVLENEGIFINYVNHATLTYGGGDVVVSGVQGTFSPIHLNEARPSLSFNTITNSAGAGIGADPNSFKDNLINDVGRPSPTGQPTRFMADYSRIGPEIYFNRLMDNSLNGLFIAINTSAGQILDRLEVAARLNDTDIVHVLSEHLVIQGTPGGALDPTYRQGTVGINAGVATLTGGTLPSWVTGGTSVTVRSPSQGLITITAGVATIAGSTWPVFAAGGELTVGAVTYRIASRDSNTQITLTDPSVFIQTPSSFVLQNTFTIKSRDSNTQFTLVDNSVVVPQGHSFILHGQVAQEDARLRIDPGIVVKIDNARIETEMGAQLIAEGLPNNRVIFTSLLDDRFGASGTFDTAGKDLGPFSQGTVSALAGVVTLVGGIWPTWAAGATLTVNNIQYTVSSRDSDTKVTLTRLTVNFPASPFVLTKFVVPAAGDWGGLYFGPVSTGSVDHALITYAGGIIPVEGGFASFNPVEIQQAEVRLTNSVLEKNENGREVGRNSQRFANDDATIFVRGAQPIIVGNTLRDNKGAAISISANSLNSDLVHDWGRSTGAVAMTGDFMENQGPLIRLNRLATNGVNGMVVRGATLTTQSVMDDTDIVHVIDGEIIVPNHHVFSGLRLQSSSSESLVVKVRGLNSGITASGSPLDINDRIGGTVQVIGTPGHPVVITSAVDSTVGAGLDPEGKPQNETIAGARAPASATSQMDIQFKMSPQLLTNTALVSALNQAASMWEQVFDDPITIVVDFTFIALGGNVGQATSVFESRPYDTVRQLMINDAGPNEAIVSQLPTFAQLQTLLPDQTYVVTPTMELTRANLLALGVPANQLTARPSIYDPLTPIDATLEFDPNFTFDFDPSDGITPGSIDFVAVATHEIGHALGFISSVDDVDAGFRNINLEPLDLFRLAPGAGAADFTNSPRILNPAAPAHVFYDGGVYTQAGVTVPPNTVGDIPLSRGVATGDGFQASHWKDQSLLGVTQEIGVMDPVITAGIRNRITGADRRAFDLIGYNSVSRGTSGDWRSVKLDQFSNDRNAATIVEREQGALVNDTPQTAQQLGQLAPNERSGDENRRLAFEVHGTVATKSDVDVYSFSARAGTEVWIDIDRTLPALDTVVELVDASGNFLARSNDSILADQTSAKDGAGQDRVSVYPMQRDVFHGKDLYGTNRHDAGLRLILPGPAGSQQTYYVRVRSSINNGSGQLDVTALNDPARLHDGQSRGGYQLQVRLRETDEIPGSTVQYADIRYASNGIEMIGTPGHSPLLGESAETTANNETRGSAQDLGNVLTVDRGAISLAGALTDYNDVDWYKFVLDWDKIDDYPDGTGIRHDDFASLTFDIDFADGAGRPDTTLALFDETGTLIYIARSSGVEDDQRAPDLASNLGEIQRGSFGPNDPYLGPVMLRENAGKTYYLAVTSDALLPDAWKNNPLSRIEPSPAQDRLVDDRVGFSWTPFYTNEARQAPGLFFGERPLNTYADPWQLGDVTMFVHDGGRLYTVDPYTGGWDTDIERTTINGPVAYGDLAMRTDGRLIGIRLTGNDSERGSTVEISPVDATGAPVGDDGITMPVPSYEAFTVFDAGNDRRIIYAVSTDGRFFAFNADTGTTDAMLTGTDNDPPLTLVELDPNNNQVPFTDTVTGLARLQGVVYGVTNTGKLISIDLRNLGRDFPDPPPVPPIMPAIVTTIATLTMPDPLRPNRTIPVPFGGMSLGPQNVEARAYSQMFFATDTFGNLHAFNRMGVRQNVFAGGRTMVDTGLPNLDGVAFASLDYNLWHVTDRQGGADGRGYYPTPDGYRGNVHVLGGDGYYFGLEEDKGQLGARAYNTNRAVYNTYNLPGGAHGTLTTDGFSLVGYDFNDAPTLYFNYFSQHDSDATDNPNNSALDSFRTYISDDGSNWFGLAQSPVPQRLRPNTFDGTAGLANDVGGWRQARIDLSPYAGLDNLRIRFDFNTSGGRDIGLTQFGGEVLSARPGAELLDGQSFILDHVDAGPTTFEFDMGYSLLVPNGAATLIADGEKFTISDGTTPTTFEFDKAGNGVVLGNRAIVITPTSTAQEIAQAIASAISLLRNPAYFPHVVDGTVPELGDVVVNLEGVKTLTQSSPAGALGLGLRGDAPGTVTQVGAVPVPVFADMTAEEVAIAIVETMDDYYISTVAMEIDIPGVFQTAKVDRDAIYLMQPSTAFTAGTGGFLQVIDAGPLPYQFLLPGDPLLFAPRDRADAGRNNTFEGVIIDDFILGLAERGEVMTNVNGGADTIPTVPMRPVGQVLEGAYQLEIRRGMDYGFPLYSVDPDGTIRYGLAYTRGWDSNDRFTGGMTLTMPPPSTIAPGSTFTIHDGINTLIYEFDLVGNGVVGPGHIAIDISTAQTAIDVAKAVGEAINAHTLLASAAGWDAGLNLLGQQFGSPRITLSRTAAFETTLTPIHINQLPIQRGETASRAVQLLFEDPSKIADGTTIAVNDGQRRILFEFDTDGFSDLPTRGLFALPLSELVDISAATTADDVAAALVAAITRLNMATVPNLFPRGLVPPGSIVFPATTAIAEYTPGNGIVELRNAVDIDIIVPDGIGTTYVTAKEDDSNSVRDQGQIVIDSNSISNSAGFGIRYDAAPRDANGSLPHPGAVRNLNEFDTARLVRGASISNNTIAGNATGGILISGDPALDPQAPIPVVRVYNNTIFGGVTPQGVGIRVNENSSPTLLNNVVASSQVGIDVDASSATTVLGATVFHRNTTNTVGIGTGTFPIIVQNGEEIFVDPTVGNFYPIAGSKVIDSSLETLQERPELANVMTAIAYSTSPLISPDRDQLGQLRVNDPAVASPPGLGSNVFKDRGAVERADFSGPTAALIDPVTGTRLDPSVTTLPILQTAPVLEFAIQLIDGVQPADPLFGSGIDDRTVINGRVLINGLPVAVSRFKLIRDGVTLVENVDYIFTYDATNNVAHFRPTVGVWTPNHRYVIRLDNSPLTGIRDLAGNTLKANNLAGTTEFNITIDPVDFGDAPAQYPTLFADNGAHHRIVAGFQLGALVTAETNGQPSQSALTDLGDDGVQLPGGFVVGESRQITVTASAVGRLDAWIDFNRDGDWNDAGEQIFTNRALSAGANSLTITVPATASFGESYARFRFSSAGGLSPSGPANDGEVEDYRIDLQALVSYTVQLNYTNGSELYRDLLNRYFVSPGLEILADIYVDDNRSVGAAGVRQAFADLVYDNDLIDFDPASLQFGPTFTIGPTGTVDEANQTVDEAGGIAPIQPPNADRQLLFRVRGTIKPTALPEQTFALSVNQADVSPAHDTLLFNSAQPVQASYESEPLVIKANPWQNAANPLDVNHNGFISGLDALIIINRLNLQGAAILPNPGQPIPGDNPPVPAYPAPFYDVNGDGRVTALDALAVINALNTGRAGPVVGAAGEGGVIMAGSALAAASSDNGVPLASSFDITPLAISVAGSGSTAVAPVLAAANAAAEGQARLNAAALESAIVDLFDTQEEDDRTIGRVQQAALEVDLLAEALLSDGWQSASNLADDPTTIALADDGVPELDRMLESLGLDSPGKKKKLSF